MIASTDVEIRINGLPDAPDYQRLADRLEEEINEAVGRAVANFYGREVDFNVRMPGLRKEEGDL